MTTTSETVLSQAGGSIPLQVDPHDRRVPRDISQLIREKELARTSAVHTLWKTAAMASIYAGAAGIGVAAALSGLWWLWIPAWAGMALVMLSGEMAYHEATHSVLTPNRRVNRVLGTGWATFLLTPWAAYRWGHIEHHRKTNCEGDPQAVGDVDKLRNIREYVVYILFSSVGYRAILWGRSVANAVGKGPSYMAKHRKNTTIDLAVSLLVLGVLVGLTVLFPYWMLMLYWGPYVAYAIFLAPLISLPEHYELPGGDLSALVITRSTRTNAVMRFFLWHNNFHAEHHLHPGIPSHNLIPIHEQLGERVIAEDSYLAWHVRLVKDLWQGNERVDRR